MSDTPLKVTLEREGRVLRLTLARPKANIVDHAMLTAIRTALVQHRDQQDLAAVLLAAEGPNFSFGASVEEHLPGKCDEMLRVIDGVVLDLLDFPLPVLVAVRGYCLGGGLEVACGGTLIFAAPGANFGQPEIQLAVFAPGGSCLLPELIGHAQAADLLYSGRTIDAGEARRIGLVHTISEDPEQAALDYIDQHLLPRSTCALRHAVAAARADLVARVRDKMERVEHRYLEELMSSHDAVEGLRAFMEKRPAKWEHR